MDVRPARPTDAPLVFTLSLDEGTHVVKSPEWPAANPALETVARLVPMAIPGRVWIAHESPNAAVLEARPRQYVMGWDVIRLAVRGEPDAVIGEVVGAALAYLQGRGVPRLFLHCSEDAAEGFREMGFNALAREFVLLGSKRQGSEDVPLPIDSRYRMPQDAWPLHQLESEITPSLVRQLEGLTSLDWSHKPKDMQEIVVEGDSKLVAWVGWRRKTRRGLNQVGLLVHPNYKDVAPDLLAHALAQVPGQPFARVREYQDEVLRVFLEEGFEVIAEEILMVKHARVEPARAARPRVKVVTVPGMQAFPSRLESGGSRTATVISHTRLKEVHR